MNFGAHQAVPRRDIKNEHSRSYVSFFITHRGTKIYPRGVHSDYPRGGRLNFRLDRALSL